METEGFSIGRGRDGDAAPFYLIERCRHDYGDVASVRECLEQHKQSLMERLVALSAILATGEPEVAEFALLDDACIRIDEVTLRPRLRERFERLMARLSEPE